MRIYRCQCFSTESIIINVRSLCIPFGYQGMIFKYIFSVSTPVLMIFLKTTVKVKVISTRVHSLFVTLNSMTFHDFQ